MKSNLPRIILYVALLAVVVVAVQVKKKWVVQDRSKEVVSLTNEVKMHGIPVDLERVTKTDLEKAVRVTIIPVNKRMSVFYFTAKEKSQFSAGQKVLSITDGKPIGNIIAIERDRGRNAGLFKGRISTKQALEGQAVDIVISKNKNLITIPVDSVDSFREQGKDFVWIKEDDKAKLVEVKLGEDGLGRIEVKSGLKVGDFVIVNGRKFLEEGKTLRVRDCHSCDLQNAEVES